MPVIYSAPYARSAVNTAVLMHLNGLTSNLVVDDANSYNIPNPFYQTSSVVTTEKAQSGTKSLKMPGGPNEAFYTNATTPFYFPGDFTIEMFFYPTVSQSVDLFGIGGIDQINWQSQNLYTDTSNFIYWAAFSNASTGGSSSSTTIANAVKSSGTFNLNQWNHVAVTRSGTSYTVFLNGVRVIAVTSSLAPYSPTYPTVIGCYPYQGNLKFDYSNAFIGYIDNWRVTKGTARYTGTSYTIPTTPFATGASDPYWANVTSLMDMETVNGTTGAPIDTIGSTWNFVSNVAQNTHVATKTNPFGGTTSVQLDGTGAGYVVNTSSTLNIGTNDFTVEFWTYSTTTSAVYKSYFSTRTHDYNHPTGFAIGLNGTGLYVYSDQFLIPVSSTAIPLNKWNHVALVRKAGVMTLYLNGVALGSYSSTVYNFTENRFGLGCNIDGTENWTGWGGTAYAATTSYMNELRVSNVARYSANFTPPTLPFDVD